MKKFGFTLAEVLITLAIVGLIAALTLPGLNSNVNNRRIGPSLAKAINNLENANRMILVEEEIGTINELGDERYVELLAERLNGSFDGETALIRGKDGITYLIDSQGVNPAEGEVSNKYSGQYYMIGIDINGDRQPNRGNSDRFAVLVDTSGSVIPAGGNEDARYNGNDEYNVSCTMDDEVIGATDDGYGYCTASVINAGWEVNYVVTAGDDGEQAYNVFMSPMELGGD